MAALEAMDEAVGTPILRDIIYHICHVVLNKNISILVCILYNIVLYTVRHHGLCHILRYRVYFHRREHLLLCVLSPFWWSNSRIRGEVVTGQSATICGDYARETGNLFYGVVPRVCSLDGITCMLSQVFLGRSRGQRRGVVYGCRRCIKRELFLLYSLTEERLDGASYEIR